MSLQDNKAVIRRLYDAFSTGDLKVMDEAFAANVVDLFPLEGQAPGVEGFKERLIGLRKSFPDLSFTIETVIADGNMAITVSMVKLRSGKLFRSPMRRSLNPSTPGACPSSGKRSTTLAANASSITFRSPVLKAS